MARWSTPFTTTNVAYFEAAKVAETTIVRLQPGDYAFVTLRAKRSI